MHEDLYTRLREYMDKMPGGYPTTDTGVELRILKKLFTPDDAAFLLKLNREPEDAATVAKRIGMDEGSAGERLEEMSRRGLIFRKHEGGKVFYNPISFLVGVYEFQLYRMDRELVELWEEFAPYLGMSLAPLLNKQLRVAPVNSAVERMPAVATYNRIRDLVSEQSTIAMTPCVCRKKERLMGKNTCQRPEELCFSFGPFAQYIIENGLGKSLTSDETLKLLDLAEESALVLSPSNSQELAFLCCCCGCCCTILSQLKLIPNPADYVQTDYQARIDAESCTACGVCPERCQIDAIKENNGSMQVDPARCIGCGLCVSTCTAEAITLVLKENPKVPPKDFEELLERLAEERGVL